MDVTLLRQQIAMVAAVTAQWFVAAGLPAIVVGYLQPPTGWAALLLAAITAYCFWTGYRAWRRGWRARFVLRLAIPVGLFVISAAVIGLAEFMGPRA